MIKSLPIQENPREKAKLYGIEKLSNIELLALVLRTGNKNESVIELSQRLLYEIGGFEQLINISYSSLTRLNGIAEAKAIELLSIIEISKRLKMQEHQSLVVKEPSTIYDYVKDEMMFLEQEHFMVLCLDNRNRILKKKVVFIGTIDQSIVYPREVFKEALSINCSRIVLIHNHPSGDPSPSDADIQITHHFEELGKMMGILVLDHIIVGWKSYYSIKTNHLFSQ